MKSKNIIKDNMKRKIYALPFCTNSDKPLTIIGVFIMMAHISRLSVLLQIWIITGEITSPRHVSLLAHCAFSLDLITVLDPWI